MSYCKAIEQMTPDARRLLHKRYHDIYYGFPIHNDDELFGRLILEINQAGLSWETILKKEQNFRKAYANFEIKKIAAFSETDKVRLLNDAGIIRNRLKINAAIENAKTVLVLQKEFRSFENWLNYHHPLTREAWTKLFKKHFRFTGGEIVSEFLMSTGYLKGAHDETCDTHREILSKNPKWLEN